MQSTKTKTTPAARSASLHRCPFCHTDVEAEGSMACQGCLARHHDACWTENGGCGSCGDPRALRPEPPRQAEHGTPSDNAQSYDVPAPRPLSLLAAIPVLLVLLGLAAVAGTSVAHEVPLLLCPGDVAPMHWADYWQAERWGRLAGVGTSLVTFLLLAGVVRLWVTGSRAPRRP